jgi:predicted dehydrogenase
MNFWVGVAGPMSSDLKVAVLGAGYFAQFHHEAWGRIPDAQLVAVADLDLERAAGAGVSAFNRLDPMLTSAKPDLLDIATPPPTHRAAVETAIAAGIKWIICQKPFCQSLSEAEEVVELAAAAGTKVIIHENFRFQPWYRAARSAMQDGLIGQPMQITFRLRTGDGQGARAYLDRQPYFQQMPKFLVHETAVHWIDTFRYLAGDPTDVYADLRRENPVIAGEDAGFILSSHPNGVRSMFDGNRHLDHAADNHRLTLGEALFEGTTGTLSLSGFGALSHRAFGSTPSYAILEAQDWQGFAGDCVHALQQHVVRAALLGETLENEARDYLTVRRIENAAYASAAAGTKIKLNGAA